MNWLRFYEKVIHFIFITTGIVLGIILQSTYIIAITLALLILYLSIIEYQPKPINIYKWIQKRYDYYDNKEGKICGEKYTDLIFYEAVNCFGIHRIDVDRLYYKGMNEYINKNQNKADKIREKKRKKSLINNSIVHSKEEDWID